MACLQYQPSGVNYKNKVHSREALFNMRHCMFDENSKLSLEMLEDTLQQEEYRLA